MPGPEPWDWNTLLWHVVQVLLYVGIGLGFYATPSTDAALSNVPGDKAALAYLVIDKLTPFSFHKEIIEDKNVALAIVLAAVFLGIALIVAASIHG